MRYKVKKVSRFFSLRLYFSFLLHFQLLSCSTLLQFTRVSIPLQAPVKTYLEIFTHISKIKKWRVMESLICFLIHMDMPIFVMHRFGWLILQSRKKGRMCKIKAIWINIEMFSNITFDLVFDSPKKKVYYQERGLTQFEVQWLPFENQKVLFSYVNEITLSGKNPPLKCC